MKSGRGGGRGMVMAIAMAMTIPATTNSIQGREQPALRG